ncbi:hypothetical protein EI427_08785 [Flammeovirga pectinis]|uniref:PPM-type phosphatase domain-containing protein n=1 Tax=Flammeovirga pectinis TaxID=2494373 RepID=A0A3S9P2B9_9BACT|nr:7TM diverse intracellular signaling domain-containing protein [Flammeovirga pectinis]AZQ62330.1 hypothetical protein EI427_08785 [Flammeovirga pectinis]
MRNTLNYSIYLIIIFLLISFERVEDSIAKNNDKPLFSYSDFLMYESEEDQLLNVIQHTSSFERYSFSKVKPGESQYWIKFDVEKYSEDPLLLQLVYSRFDHLELYRSFDNKTFEKVGEGGILYDNELKKKIYRGYSYFPISLEDKNIAHYYLKCNNDDKPFFEFQAVPKDLILEKTAKIDQKINSLDLILYLFIGAVSLMILYNFCLYFMVKDKGYIYYALHATAVLIFNYCFSGKIIFHLENAEYFQQIIHWSGFTSAALFLIFGQYILNVKSKYSNLYTILNIVIVGLMILNVFVYFEWYFVITPLGTILINATYLPLIYIAKREKSFSITAKFFYYGILINFVFITLHIFQTFDLLPVLFGYKNVSALLIGSGLEQMIFSLSLGAKITDSQAKVRKLMMEQNVMLENEVSRRTKDLLEAKEEVEIQNETLSEMNSRLGKQHDNIKSSINYAKRIQDASLPTIKNIGKYVNDFSVLHIPRDTVSGDFYWFKRVRDKTIVIVGDCTGHGVPGALMSILAIQKIETIVSTLEDIKPSVILEQLDQEIRYALNQKSSHLNDGMDAVVCVIDEKKKEIEYSGAKNPLVVIQENELKVFKGSRNSIGGNLNFLDDPFNDQTISYKDSPITMYMYSDGYQDQFGANGKKFMPKKFKNLLLEISKYNHIQQEKILYSELNKWTNNGKIEQIDDILVFGMSLE